MQIQSPDTMMLFARSFLRGKGKKGQALIALLDLLKDAELQGVTHINSGVEMDILVRGHLAVVRIEMSKAEFDALWLETNANALMPKLELTDGAQ